MLTDFPRDKDHDVHIPVESCEVPAGIQLVYADDRDRQRTVALEGAALLDFGRVKAFRRPPAYRGLLFPGGDGCLATSSIRQERRPAPSSHHFASIMSDQMSYERSHDTMLTQGPLYSS